MPAITLPELSTLPPGFGLRLPSGAFHPANAAEDCRTLPLQFDVWRSTFDVGRSYSCAL